MARIRVAIKPRARINAITAFDEAGLLSVSITAPPIEGRANKELSEFLGKALGVPKSTVNVVAGDTSRVKTVEFSTLNDGQVRDRIGSALLD